MRVTDLLFRKFPVFLVEIEHLRSLCFLRLDCRLRGRVVDSIEIELQIEFIVLLASRGFVGSFQHLLGFFRVVDDFRLVV